MRRDNGRSSSERGGQEYVFTFEDFEEFLCVCTDDSSDLPEQDRSSRDTDEYESQWSGTATFEDAVQLAVQGCSELEEQVLRIAENIVARTGLGSRDYRLDAVYDVAGDEVDVGRFLEGEPECMVTYPPFETRREGGKIITINAQAAMAAMVSKKQIANRGAAMLALVWAAEQAGYRVELNSIYGIGGNNDDSTCAIVVRLKNTDQPVDLSRLAFMLMHPSSLRRLGFSFMEIQPYAFRDAFCVSGAYGLMQGKGERRALKSAPACDLLLGGNDWKQFETEKSALQWALNTAREFGLVEQE